ncbi:hypothetical protein [Paenibacillus caseinilyticus]|nr:hypothetical protein [Paenibacillus caseinilyticus]MCZ8521936.1 hypothetical protein [Paenibacillus caseinilyticus]
MKQSAAEAARLAQQTLEVTKLNAQIASREKEVERKQLLAGQAAVSAYAAGNIAAAQEAVAEQAGAILDLQKEIEGLQAQVLAVKSEKACRCGHHLPRHALFCSKCGYKFTGDALTGPGEEGP